MSSTSNLGSTAGDTLIVLSKRNAILAHASILRENCTVLTPFLTEQKGAKLIPAAHRHSKLRWRVDLTYNQNIYAFEAKRVDGRGFTEGVHSVNDETVDKDLLDSLKDTLRILYGKKPYYGTTIQDVLDKGLQMLKAGKILGALSVVRDKIQKEIMDCEESLWPHIAEKPAGWLVLGYELQARAIYKEALIHCVGKWRLMSSDERKLVSNIEPLRVIILVKLVNSIKLKKQKERCIAAYHADFLKDMPLGDNGAPGRAAYSANILAWIATDIFRQFLAQVVIGETGFHAADGGYNLYSAISKGGENYLKRNDLENFFGIFPMSDRAKAILCLNLNAIKDGVKKFVDPLVISNAVHRDVMYLTNTLVDDQDYPWLGSIPEDLVHEASVYPINIPDYETILVPSTNANIEDLLLSDLTQWHSLG